MRYTSSKTTVIADVRFIISNQSGLIRSGGIQATVQVSPNQQAIAHNGHEVIVFQLMHGTTPINIVALKADMTVEQEYTAFFSPTQPSPNENAEIVFTKNPDEHGTVQVDVTSDALRSAWNESKKDTITLNITSSRIPNEVIISLPTQQVKEANENKVNTIHIHSVFGVIEVSLQPFITFIDSNSTQIQLQIKQVDKSKLTDSIQAKLGDNSVYDFKVNIDRNEIHEFNDQPFMSIGIPFNLGMNEQVSQVVVYYIDDQGNMKVVVNGKYNEKSGEVTFKPKHLSQYAAAYVPVSFNDITKVAWAKEGIESLAAREVISGKVWCYKMSRQLF